MIRATRPPSSGAWNCTSSLWFCIISWKVVGRAVVGRCQVALPDNVQQLHVAVLGSWWWAVCRPKHVELHLKQGIIKFWYTVASSWFFSVWIILWRTDPRTSRHSYSRILLNPLKPELNPICYLLVLLGAHHFLHVSRIRVKLLTLRRLMSYIYGAPILDVSRSHTTTQHSR